MADEDTKDNADRLARIPRNRPANRWSKQLFSEAPIYDDLEIAKLADSLSMFMEQAGADNEWVRKTLQGKSPQARADELVRGTRLKDVAVRKKLAKGGRSAIEGSNDPMILLARLIDPPAREVRKNLRRKSRRADEAGLRENCQGRASPSKGTEHLSRRHVHAPPGLRPGERLQARWQRRFRRGPRSAARSSMPTFMAPSRRSRCPHSWLNPPKPLNHGYAVQLRLHGRHHRRQQRQPGGQQGRRIRAASSSTATSNRWCSISPTPTSRPGP